MGDIDNWEKKSTLEMEGEVLENLPNATFKVKLENGS